MIILASTSDLLQLITTGAGPVAVHASFVDFDGTSVDPGRKNLNISTASTTTVVPAPGSGSKRNVKLLVIHNDPEADSQSVTVRMVTAASTVVLRVVQLASGESLVYKGGRGFQVLTTAVDAKYEQGVAALGSPLGLR